MKKCLTHLLSILIWCTASAQSENTPEPIPYIKKSICIILSTTSYNEAKKVAKQAKIKCKIPIDYRDLIPNQKIGLTLCKADCQTEELDYPAYYSRGRNDDGEYISIEYSNAYQGFTKGYYIVVVYSGDKAAAENTLKKVKPFYKTAYIKLTEVYIGCMH
jgi:hypothetical protein